MVDKIVIGESSKTDVPAVSGTYTGTGDTYVHNGGTGVKGYSKNGYGVWGDSNVGRGVVASSKTNYGLRASSETLSAIRASSVEGTGVEGQAAKKGTGVVGTSDGGTGVHGKGKGAGVVGEGETWHGVAGFSNSTTGGAGVWGEHKGGGDGVRAVSTAGVGLAAFSTSNEAIHAETKSLGTAAIAAYNLNPEGTGAALFAKKEGTKGHAGFFVGTVWIGGELGVEKDIILANADCAEDFDMANAELVEPGTVMVLGDDGALQPGQSAYDKRVAGVVSGAGHYKPGIVLDKQGGQPNRKPIALLGKVYCKVDASHASVEVGDLLTTSPTPGHAMKATDQFKAFGAVIGKALRPLAAGQDLIPILIALQ